MQRGMGGRWLRGLNLASQERKARAGSELDSSEREEQRAQTRAVKFKLPLGNLTL